jgi:hypothetical protein
VSVPTLQPSGRSLKLTLNVVEPTPSAREHVGFDLLTMLGKVNLNAQKVSLVQQRLEAGPYRWFCAFQVGGS